MGHKAPEESEGVLLEKENRKQKDRATPRGRLEERFVRLSCKKPDEGPVQENRQDLGGHKGQVDHVARGSAPARSS